MFCRWQQQRIIPTACGRIVEGRWFTATSPSNGGWNNWVTVSTRGNYITVENPEYAPYAEQLDTLQQDYETKETIVNNFVVDPEDPDSIDAEQDAL